jgi:hypothetical protein
MYIDMAKKYGKFILFHTKPLLIASLSSEYVVEESKIGI